MKAFDHWPLVTCHLPQVPNKNRDLGFRKKLYRHWLSNPLMQGFWRFLAPEVLWWQSLVFGGEFSPPFWLLLSLSRLIYSSICLCPFWLTWPTNDVPSFFWAMPSFPSSSSLSPTDKEMLSLRDSHCWKIWYSFTYTELLLGDSGKDHASQPSKKVKHGQRPISRDPYRGLSHFQGHVAY